MNEVAVRAVDRYLPPSLRYLRRFFSDNTLTKLFGVKLFYIIDI